MSAGAVCQRPLLPRFFPPLSPVASRLLLCTSPSSFCTTFEFFKRLASRSLVAAIFSSIPYRGVRVASCSSYASSSSESVHVIYQRRRLFTRALLCLPFQRSVNLQRIFNQFVVFHLACGVFVVVMVVVVVIYPPPPTQPSLPIFPASQPYHFFFFSRFLFSSASSSLSLSLRVLVCMNLQSSCCVIVALCEYSFLSLALYPQFFVLRTCEPC